MLSKNQFKIKNEEIIPDIIGKPFNNPFEIFVFNIKEKIIKFDIYDKSAIETSELNNYDNSFSAYCNGNNFLYISGGENKNHEIINKLWKIDLKNNKINEPTQIPPKKNHSMIFIPDNYIFIVGGNDKKTFYIDDNISQVSEWGDLNEERFEPALIRISNTLYCFDKISNDNFSVEQTNLSDKSYEWKLIKPLIGPTLKNEKFTQKCFAVVRNDDNNIIFFGGNMENINKENNKLVNFKYNLSNNTIESSDIIYNNYKFKEKTFFIYNNDIKYILPDFSKENPEIILYAKNKKKFEKNVLIKKENNNTSSSLEYIFPDSIFELYPQENNKKINSKNTNSINDIKNNDINDNNSINNKIENKPLNNSIKKNIIKKRSNSYKNYFSNYNNNIIIPNFHGNIDDPGNELNIIKKGAMYNNYYQFYSRRTKQFSKELQFNNPNLYFPNYNSFNSNDAQNYDGIFPGEKITNKNGTFSWEGIIPGLKSHKNLKDNNIHLKKEDYILKGKIPGINNEKLKINLQKTNIKNPQIEIKSSPQINIPENENKKDININIEPNPEINKNINPNNKVIPENNIIKENKINKSNIENPLEIKLPSGINEINRSNDIKDLDKKSNNSKISHSKTKTNNNLKSPNIKIEFKKDIFFQKTSLNEEILRENKKKISKFRNSSYDVKGKRRIYNYNYSGIIKGVKTNLSKDKKINNPSIENKPSLINKEIEENKISNELNSNTKSHTNITHTVDNNLKSQEKNDKIIASNIEIKNDIKINKNEIKENTIQENIKNNNSQLVETQNINIVNENNSPKTSNKNINSSKRGSKSSNIDNRIDKKSDKNNLDKSNKNDNKQSILTFGEIKVIPKNNNEMNSINNNNDIIFEKSKDEINQQKSNKEIYKPKIGSENKINNNLGSKVFTENGCSLKVFSPKGNSKKRSIALPLVGQKKNDFEMSKFGKVGKLDIMNIDINNLRSTHVGVNGVKFANKIND